MESVGFIQATLDFVAANHEGWGPVVLFFSSLVEYVFPPFPGDVITLFGTYLVVQGLWSIPFALALVTAGSLVGATVDYYIGRWLGRRLDNLPSESQTKGWRPLTREKYDLLKERFRRHGVAYIAINRFLPGIRAFFFVVAGAARMRLSLVLLFALISALAWNGLILGLGLALGANWERLRSIVTSYTTGAWILLGILALGAVGLWFRRRRKSVRTARGGGGA